MIINPLLEAVYAPQAIDSIKALQAIQKAYRHVLFLTNQELLLLFQVHLLNSLRSFVVQERSFPFLEETDN